MLRLSELYVSTQGEGQHVGKMTAFVRFAGCNMRCPGWPCDTQHAIDPAIWRHESSIHSAVELFQMVIDVCHETGARNICYTGGEPFMQQKDDLKEMTKLLVQNGYSVEVFTNGSFVFPEWSRVFMDFMMDWKLTGSGEAQTHRGERLINARQLKETDGIKFVATNLADLTEAMSVSQALRIDGVKAEFWVGSAWAQLYERDIVEFLKVNRLDWRLNVQVHKYVWPADERRV